MRVKLKVVQGTLKKQSGKGLPGQVAIRRSRFLIGGAEDCNMRCPSSSVSAHHCELLVDDRGVRIHDLHSDTGTFVNGKPVDGETGLNNGDTLRIGRLEFTVEIELGGGSEADPVADYVSNLLVEADEQDRARRLEDPQSRHFEMDAAEMAARQDAADSDELPKTFKRPAKKPPGKLPPPPKYVADNTAQAAEETLKKIFGPK